MNRKSIPAILLILVLLLAGCAAEGERQKLTDAPLTGSLLADFAVGIPSRMSASDGWTNGEPFNVLWKGELVSFADNEMHLAIASPDEPGDGWEYYGSEERSKLWYGCGDFETRMRPAKVDGTVSSFFTCTGPYDIGLGGLPNQHDEIDIEFIGQDTTFVRFNYFVNGQGGHEYMYELGFDASEDFHNYGFRWEETAITWFVDGKPVYKVIRQEGEPWPSHPGRIITNYWCGTAGAVSWLGEFKGSDATADYKWIKTNAEGIDFAPSVETDDEAPVGVEDIDWTLYNPIDLTFVSNNGKHSVRQHDSAYSVTFSEITNDWSNVTAVLTGKTNGGNVLNVKLRNDDSSDQHTVRIDLIKNGKCVNTSATMDGAEVYTDLEWGGSFFENVPSGEEAELVIVASEEPDTLVIMLDSTHQGDDTAYSGACTFTDFKFASAEGAASSAAAEQEPEPVMVISADTSALALVNGLDVEFTSDGSYGVLSEDGKLTAVYTNLAGNSYATVYGDCAGLMGGTGLFTAKITNNGAETVNVRVDIATNDQVGNSTAANTAATQNGAEAYTDLEWGGSTFSIQPGDTADIAVAFDTGRSMKGLLFFIDSSKYDDGGVHTGSVTVSDMSFTEGTI